MRNFFLRSYIVLSVVTMIAATWFLGQSMGPGSRYEGGWIFGLAWFPIVAFGFIEWVNAQHIPERALGAVQVVFLPYVWTVIFALWQHQSIEVATISACISTFIAAFCLHAFALRAPLRDAGKSAISEVLIPHLFLDVPAAILAWLMVRFLWSSEGGSVLFAVGIVAAIAQRIVGMYPSLKNLLS